MIIISSDHAGIELKNKIIKYLEKRRLQHYDINLKCDKEGIDYPDVAKELCHKVLESSNNLGIIICGTGIGVCISSNKIKGIRAALCTDAYMAEMSRKHNNANVLCLGARLESTKDDKNVEMIVQAFIDNFFEGGRHDRRVNKIKELENVVKEGEN